MTEGFAGIITQLEQQKTAIERALVALREVDGMDTPASAASRAPAKRRGRPKKAAEATPVETLRTAAPRKPQFTPAGRQKLAEAMKQRWAAKRAAAAVKKAGRKKQDVPQAV
jgi:hypothetical protein